MTRRTFDAFFLALLTVTVCAAGLIGGCRAQRAPSDSGIVAASSSVGRAEARNDAATNSIALAKPHADRQGQEHLQSATSNLTEQKQDLTDVETALERERQASAAKDARIDKLDAGLTAERDHYAGYKLRRLAKLITIGLIAAIAAVVVLRSVALALPGPWGAVCSFVATAILGLITGGCSLVQSLFDNLWFRKFRPATQPAPA
jgi:hypothetical protein